MKYRRFLWIIIPLVSFVFLWEMVFLGRIPLASDTVSIRPIEEWVDAYSSRHDDLPHWYPYVFGGMPSYGSYIYTPGDPSRQTLRLVLINRGLAYWFHFALGGVGIYLLLRRRATNMYAALFGGISFALTPYLFGLINAGHSSKIIAISYIPWIFMSADYCLRERKLQGILYLGLVAALQLWSNHPQIVYYTWMLIVFWWIWLQIDRVLKKKWSIGQDGVSLGLLVGGLGLALVLVSDPYLSVYEFQKHSNRGAPSVLDTSADTGRGTTWEYATQWSFHPKEMISFLYPYFYGLQNYPTRDMKSAAYWGHMPFTQSTHYLGLLVVLTAILGALLRKPDRWQAFLWASTAVILLIGFGRYFPILFGPLFKFAPYFSKFRVPSLIYVLLAFTLSILAAGGLNTILGLLSERNDGKLTVAKKRILITFGGFIAITLVLLLTGESFISFVKTGEAGRYAPRALQEIKAARVDLFQQGLVATLALAGGSLAVLWLSLRGKLSSGTTGVLIIVLSMGDLWYVDKDFLHLKSPIRMKQQFQPTPQVKFISKDENQFRILPADDMNTNWYGYFGLSSVGGYRPVKLRTYQDLMDAGGFNSVSILNMLNVKYLISSRDIQLPGFERVFSGGKSVYENLSVLPRAWFVSDVVSVSTQKESLERTVDPNFDPSTQAIVVGYDGPEPMPGTTGHVDVSRYSENQIVLRTASPQGGLVVLSENYYEPGWKAMVDNVAARIYQTNHVLRSVFVPLGEHTVSFEYNTTLFDLSRAVSRISLLFILLVTVFVHRQNLLNLVSRFSKKS